MEPGHTLKNVEVFAVGHWNGEEFVESDLKDAVAAYEALRGKHHIPLKLGHTQKQILSQENGQPALGWAENFKVKGNKLVADIFNIPSVVFNAIQSKLFRKLSIEFYADVPIGKRRYRLLPKAIALLGADMPEVIDLKGLDTYMHSAELSNSPVLEYSKELTLLAPESETQKMDEDKKFEQQLVALKQQLQAEFSVKFKEQETKLAEKDVALELLKKESAVQAERARVAEFDAKLSGLKTQLEAQVKAGSIAPALRDKVIEFSEKQKDAFKPNGEISFSTELLQEVLKVASAKLPKGEVGENTKVFTPVEDAGSKLHEIASKAVAEAKLKGNTLEYGSALELAYAANPDLTSQYLDEALKAEPNFRKGN